MSAVRPFSLDSCRRTLYQACSVAGLDSSDAELLRLGETAVFRLRSPVVARVSRTASYVDRARREVEVARWLANKGFPAMRAIGVEQPVVTDGRVVTFWEAVDSSGFARLRDLASLLRQLHGLEPPRSFDLPQLDQFAWLKQRLEMANGLSDEDKAFLEDRAGELAGEWAGMDFELPSGVIHGDASVGNVLIDSGGSPVLIDLDDVVIGPLEWDLVLPAAYDDTFGWHSSEDYGQFTKVYGWDVRVAPGYSVMRELRCLMMVAWLSQNADQDPDIADELAIRMRTLHDGTSRQCWRPR